MDTLRLRSTPRYLATSRVVVVFCLFLLVLVPLLVGLLLAARTAPWPVLFFVAAAAPAFGLLAAAVMLAARLWRRSRPVLLIDDHLTIPRTGIRFPLDKLAHLQLYNRGGVTHLVLLPGHVSERVPARAVDPYTVAFPAGANYLPLEFVELVGQRVSGVGVDKLGTL
ncbi:hypothetical protein [Corynebacterium sp.]|uniref:hypothetical protein n=1 Tax=Corynebacterium sp. TaxID=1720 RepID=UPI0026E06138|nr:hypothetical protein [Corynebacterium sp.]MDO5513331.1 hypothetical protein [Corynebacterium sp.]